MTPMDVLHDPIAFVLTSVVCLLSGAAVGAVAVLAAATAFAIVKPHIQHLIDAYVDWFERRTNL